ncbi:MULTISPECIES: TetR/AcrR family transcriptional regulator [unclassified Clostridium]|uniref:TetR/AcrR family transcriptional regulator n=1 Tax=unclassified Clostridium TaxID=2614128 RepID=UPI000297C986|nr:MULTISPECIES: TetR/AcrR family transcriptional regulator [unclassified Clostridium]EKQ57700.1 MAG: transcriptional regulator [Clostridium sp. Maddingley MBC34-26]
MARPREFNKEEALKQAMKVFWRKGYDSTSVSDLTKAMGISRSSMYETFIDKQNLFIETMNYYSQLVGSRRTVIFNTVKSVKQGVKDYLDERINMALDEEYPGGCFITNTATSLETADERVKTAIKLSTEKIENEFFAFLELGKTKGEIGGDKDTRALARFLLGLTSGINVVARVQKNRKVLEDMVKCSLDILG